MGPQYWWSDDKHRLCASRVDAAVVRFSSCTACHSGRSLSQAPTVLQEARRWCPWPPGLPVQQIRRGGRPARARAGGGAASTQQVARQAAQARPVRCCNTGGHSLLAPSACRTALAHASCFGHWTMALCIFAQMAWHARTQSGLCMCCESFVMPEQDGVFARRLQMRISAPSCTCASAQ